MWSLSAVLAEEVERAFTRPKPLVLADGSNALGRPDPAIVDATLKRIATADRRQNGDRHATIGNADDFTRRYPSQVLGQVLLEFTDAHVHVDTLLLM